MKKITLLAMSFVMALMVNAQEAGTDVTSLFENTDFESGTVDGWENNGPSNSDSRGAHAEATAANHGYQGTYFMEAWNSSGTKFNDFDWSQTAEVPDGYYLVKALAHAIQQSDNSAPQGIYLYAEDQQTPVTTTAAAEYSVLAKVSDGTLTIGYRGVGSNVNWAGCDYFRVIQCNGDTEEAATISWMKNEMNELQALFEDEILEQPMSQALKDEIEESIAAMEDIVSSADAEALWNKMKQQYADALACIEAYEKLILKIDEVYAFADEEGADELYAAADEADAKYQEGSLDAAGALAEIEALNDAVFAYNLSVADGTTGFEVTDLFVKDPTVRTKEQTAAWTINVTNNKNAMPAWGHDCIEFWSCDFTLSQTIENIPNGKYKIRVQGFYRAGGNDSGAGYNDNTEVITANLFGNNEEQPFVSIYKYTAAEMGVTENLKNGYVDGLTSAGIAFGTVNGLTGRNYYDENELEVIVMDNKLTFGVRNASTVGDRWCIFRDFKLYYYGNYPSVNLFGKSETIKSYIANNLTSVPYAVNVEVSNFLRSIQDYTIDGKYSDEEVNAVILQLDSVWANALKAIDLFAELKVLAERIEKELLPLDYPGKAKLNGVLESMQPYFDEASTVNTYANMEELKVKVEAAILEYYYSQVATPEAAADYSFLIPNANFEQKGNWTWSMSAGGTDQWIGGCRPTEVGGANRQGINLWGWGITSVDVHQMLTNLPDGLYKVGAEMITQTNYATDQQVYAAAASEAVSEELTVEGWDSCIWTELVTTDYAVVIGGRLTIGAKASQGGTNSEGWFQATNFKLYYHGAASAEQLQAAWESTEERANEALDILIPNEKKELADVMAKATPLAAEGKYGDACALVIPVMSDLDSVLTATKNFYGSYYARLDTLRSRPGYENCDSTHLFADAVVAMVDEILSSDTVTCKAFDDINAKLQAYSSYVASLRDADDAINDTVNLYPEKYEAFVADSVVRPQVDSLLCNLRSVEFCNQLRDMLDEAVNILKGTVNFGKEVNEGDVTYLIVNPQGNIEGDDVNNVPGWTWVKGNGDKATHDAEHYDVNEQNVRFLNSWAPGLTSTFYQNIIGLPDGTYKLTVAARTDGDNAYVFASTTPSGISNDTTSWLMVKNYGNTRGEIWSADSLAWVEAGCPDDEATLKENFPYFMARPDTSTFHGIGYGWSWHVIENIEVTTRFLSIGFTADNAVTGKGNFTGTWMSADDWKLELIKKNDVQSEYDPFANFNNEIVSDDVEHMELAPAPQIIVRDGAIYSSTGAPVVVYSIDGKRAATAGLSRGIYIVICENTVAKVVVR